MRFLRGFTVVELLVTMAVVGILAAIAFPSYQAHVRKGARSAAEGAMMQIANREAQYLLDARNYTVGPTALTDLSITLTNDVAAKYTITITNSTGGTTPSAPPTYLITATPIAGGPQVPDGVLTLDNTGAKTRAGNPGW
jgi:type IV pilus assembly protein PilE